MTDNKIKALKSMAVEPNKRVRYVCLNSFVRSYCGCVISIVDGIIGFTHPFSRTV